MVIRSLLCFVLAAAALCAQSQPSELASGLTSTPAESRPHVSKLWIVSSLALLAATSLDAGSSWGKYEANPLLRSSDGRFGARGVSIKFAMAGAALAPQFLLHRNHTATRLFTVVNFAQAGMYSGIAIHNFGIPSPSTGQPTK